MSAFSTMTRAALAVCIAASSSSAFAKDRESNTVSVTAQTEDLGGTGNTLRVIELGLSRVREQSTLQFTGFVGERRAGSFRETAVGGSVQLYRTWSPKVSSRSEVFLAENKTPFAHWAVAQDVTVKVGSRTTFTGGARYARYVGNNDVVFVSGGARRYFHGGSIAYRLTWTKPDLQSGYFAHLASLTVNDRRGEGRTQLWLSYGAPSQNLGPSQVKFTSGDLGATLQRVQPLTGPLNAVLRVGISSYDRPGGRTTGAMVGGGLAYRF